MKVGSIEFGYYPCVLTIQSGSISIETLPNLVESVRNIEGNEDVLDDWIYAPPQHVVQFPTGGARKLPYRSRIFGLPKTHRLIHSAADGGDHLDFILWVLSFLTGMRLTSTGAGFVDSTPIRPGRLVDFTLLGKGLEHGLALADAFWATHRSRPGQARCFAAATHALFMAQHRQHLQFERLMLLFAGLDACFTLATASHLPPPRIGHTRRVAWMCGLFGIPLPDWADPNATGGTQAAVIRNEVVHDALLMGQPLGFALHGLGSNMNLPLEVSGLISRLLVALLGAPGNDYVRTPVSTRQRQGLGLP